MKVYPYKREGGGGGDAGKVLAILKAGTQSFRGSFITVAWKL